MSKLVRKVRQKSPSSPKVRLKKRIVLGKPLSRPVGQAELETLFQRLNFAVQASKDGLWYAEIPSSGIRATVALGQYVWCTSQLKEMLGFEDHNYPNTVKKLLVLVHPEDIAELKATIQKHIKSKSSFEIECRVRLRQSGYRWFSIRGEALPGSNGKTLRIAGSFRDIDRRKVAETALMVSKKLFDDLVEGTPIATFVIDHNHKVIYWNKAMEDLTGLKAVDMIGTNHHWKPFYSKQRSMITDMMIAGTKKQDILEHYQHMDVEESSDKSGLVGSVFFTNFRGHKRWLRFMIKPLRDPQNKIVGVIETVEDISERKITSDALAKRIRELQVLYRVEGHMRMVHSLKKVLMGITRDVAMACREVEHARSLIIFDGESYSTLKKGERLVCKITEPIEVNGEKRGTIEMGYSKKLLHENGSLFKEEKRLLQMIAKTIGKHVGSREVIQRYEKLVRKSSIGIYIVQNCKLQYVNPKFAKIFKFKEKELIGEQVGHFIIGCNCHEKFAQDRLKNSHRCIAQGRQKDHSLIDIEVVTQKIEYYGKPAILGTVQDVSKLKYAEEKLKNFNRELKKKIDVKTRDLEEANRSLRSLNELKDEFIAVTSHELRSPLTAIRGYLSFMVDESIFNKMPEMAKDYLMRAYDNVEVLNNLMNNILDVSRIDTNRLELYKTPFDLIHLIQSVIHNLNFQAQQKNLSIHFENFLNEKTLILRLDGVRMRQVLRNIIENAIKYSPKGKPITITLQEKGIGLEIDIIDQGVGIPKTEIFDIFDKFKQAKNSHARYKGGAGLGLFIAKKIVELHGGMIWATSTYRKGTTFKIQLPLD